MAGKDKLSNEVEEQIQSLARDVYILIEEKLTHFISTATPKEPAKQISIKQSLDYFALQANYQTSQNELAQKNKKLSEQIYQLEQALSVHKKKPRQEQTEANVQNQQSQIVSNEKKLLEQAQALSQQQQINQLEIKNQELTNRLITEQADIKLYQKKVSSLKSQVTLAQEGQQKILNRFNASREKQEKDNDKVRETIKYLRDENNDMITDNNRQKEAFIEQTSELENKLTEYRLKFEYAQKQLTQNS
jgi:tRNA U34 5-methylaminomethyl-2-thiouridine-forming methyltransferase MnmC